MAAGQALDRECVLQALRAVLDPELGYNIVDLGLIYQVEVEAGVITVRMTMTTPGCPAQDYLMSGVHECCMSLPGATEAKIELVWLPAWSPQRMTPIAKAHFGIQD